MCGGIEVWLAGDPVSCYTLLNVDRNAIGMTGAKIPGVKALNSRTRRGLTLATVLLCMVALILILLTAGTAAVNHLRFATARETADHAQNLAEAALAEAYTKLVEQDFVYGKQDATTHQYPAPIVVTVADLPGGTGEVTFDPGTPGFSSGYSINNINDDNSVNRPDGGVVPGRSVYVLARGKVGTTERWVECVYYRPPFPDGLACSGAADGRSVQLAAIRSGSVVPANGDPMAIPPDEALPANIFSNTTTSVSGSSIVTGSVGAVGSVSVTANCQIQGEVLPGSEARAIPDVRLDEKFAIVEQNNTPVSSSSGDLTLSPNFFMLADSGLNVGGDLDLNGSVLLVKGGDLKVNGAVKGTGIILGERDIEIRDGGAHLDTAEQVAIGCKGNFKLQAQSPLNNFFNGLVYAEGDIEAKDITVVGAVVGNGKRGAAGNVTLDNVRFIYNPGALDVVVYPALVTAREWSNDAQFSMFSASVRRKPDGSGWLANAWVGLQVTKRKKTKAEKQAFERGVNENDWDLEKIKAIAPATFVEHTWKNIDIPNGIWTDDTYGNYSRTGGALTPEQDLALRQAFAYNEAMKLAATWLDANDNEGSTGAGKESWYSRMSSGWTLNKGGDPNRPPEDGTVHFMQIINQHRAALTNQQPSGVIHFNLNNLLAEFNANTSRVLLWRPVSKH